MDADLASIVCNWTRDLRCSLDLECIDAVAALPEKAAGFGALLSEAPADGA
jgi:hypothetical protein